MAETNRLPRLVTVGESIRLADRRQARRNRQRFHDQGVLAIHFLGCPGCGKSSLLAATARALAGRFRMAALSAGLATERDTERLESAGIRCFNLPTRSACHLDASWVQEALAARPSEELPGEPEPWQRALAGSSESFLWIESAGNLICPALYDLGQHVTVIVLSVTEGADLPLKYPVVFRTADLVVLSKIDLLPHLPDADLETFIDNLARVMPDPDVLALSAFTGEGMQRWLNWLESQRGKVLGR